MHQSSTQIKVEGSVSASTYYGDGSNLTGITAGYWTGSADGSITRNSDTRITGSLLIGGDRVNIEITENDNAFLIYDSPNDENVIHVDSDLDLFLNFAENGYYKVGIGTSTPQTLLHVFGTVSASTYYGDGSNLTNISASYVPIGTGSYWTGSANGSISRQSNVKITGSLLMSGSSTYAIDVNGYGLGVSVRIPTAPNSQLLLGGNTEIYYVDEIGLFDISNDLIISAYSQTQGKVLYANANIVVDYNNSYVGIGNVNPPEKLTVEIS